MLQLKFSSWNETATFEFKFLRSVSIFDETEMQNDIIQYKKRTE